MIGGWFAETLPVEEDVALLDSSPPTPDNQVTDH
jgi:hypothetical protein